MSLPKFNKKNIKSTKGRQGSKYDVYLQEFTQPGDSLQFDEEDMSRQTASQIAKRFRDLEDKPFHSFWDAKEKKVTIRLRLDSEIDQDKEEEDEQNPFNQAPDPEEEASDEDEPSPFDMPSTQEGSAFDLD